MASCFTSPGICSTGTCGKKPRRGNDKEFAATTVMRISLAEAACKLRTGGPNDDAEDMGVAAWAGVLPLVQQRGMPVVDPLCTVPAPAYVQQWAA